METNDKPKMNAPKQKRYRLVNTPNGGWKEIAGLPFKVTAANVNNENVIAAVMQAERRLGRRIIGVDIVYE